MFELAYYVMLYVIGLLALAPRLDAIALAWLAVLGVARYIGMDPGGQNVVPACLMPFVMANIPFAAGLLLPRLVQRRMHPLHLLVMAGALFFVGSAGAILTREITSLSAVLAIGAAASFTTRGKFATTDFASRTLGKLGDFSYALYLCHVPIIVLLYRNAALADPWLFWFLAIGLAVVACIPLGMIDVALYGRLKRFVDGLDTRVAHVTAGAYLVLR